MKKFLFFKYLRSNLEIECKKKKTEDFFIEFQCYFIVNNKIMLGGIPS